MRLAENKNLIIKRAVSLLLIILIFTSHAQALKTCEPEINSFFCSEDLTVPHCGDEKTNNIDVCCSTEETPKTSHNNSKCRCDNGIDLPAFPIPVIQLPSINQKTHLSQYNNVIFSCIDFKSVNHKYNAPIKQIQKEFLPNLANLQYSTIKLIL